MSMEETPIARACHVNLSAPSLHGATETHRCTQPARPRAHRQLVTCRSALDVTADQQGRSISESNPPFPTP